MEKIKPLRSTELQSLIDKYRPFLIEARKRFFFTFTVFAISSILGFVFYEQIIKFLIEIFSLKGVNIVFTSPFQFINLSIACGVATGLVLSLPLLIAQILSFLRPALKEKEYKTLVGFIPFSLGLFLVGFTFGAIIMKWQIEIFLEKSVSLGIGNILDISSLLTTVLLTATFLGIGFQFPIILLLLLKLGLVNRNQLSKIRPWVYLGSFFFAILLPPESILADVILALPLVVLFEITLLLDRLGKKES